jgi:hypothetical protein
LHSAPQQSARPRGDVRFLRGRAEARDRAETHASSASPTAADRRLARDRDRLWRSDARDLLLLISADTLRSDLTPTE